MKPFVCDDVGKAWGIESHLKPVDIFLGVMPLVEAKVRETIEIAQDPASIENPSESQSSHADSQDMHV